MSSFTNHYAIQTPEQISVSFDVAGIGSRFLALLIDTMIQGAALILGAIVIGLLSAAGVLTRSRNLAGIAIGLFIIIAFLLFYAYFVLFEIFWNGQTPGKRVIGIRVIKDSGRRLSAVESIGRNLLRIVDQLPGFYAIGILCAVLNKQNKRLGDIVAGSVVVREAALRTAHPIWQEPSADALPLAPMGAERLTPDDVVLIEAFLQRRHDLEPEVRYRMAAEVLRRLEGKLTIHNEDRPGIERILEAAVHERRSKSTA